LNLAAATSRVQAAAMAKKRQLIENFIDALMCWCGCAGGEAMYEGETANTQIYEINCR
jgi:hypothetical protein